jgi:hypothetical protein
MRFMSSFVKIRLVAQNLNLTEKYADLILNGKLILVCKVCVSECWHQSGIFHATYIEAPMDWQDGRCHNGG